MSKSDYELTWPVLIEPGKPYSLKMPEYLVDHQKAIVRHALEFCDGKMEVTVRAIKKSRTGKQNRMLHAIIGYICNETGHTKDEIKYQLKYMLYQEDRWPALLDEDGNERISPFTGLPLMGSTKKANTKEESDLIEKALYVCQELGIMLPDMEDR